MTKENGKQFVIPSKKLNTIVTTLKTYSVEPIMTGEIVRRCLYKVNNEGPQTDDNYKWLRIMEGDVECDGENRITITYKDKKKDMSGVDSALLTVDNFDDATHLFELLHFEKDSPYTFQFHWRHRTHHANCPLHQAATARGGIACADEVVVSFHICSKS